MSGSPLFELLHKMSLLLLRVPRSQQVFSEGIFCMSTGLHVGLDEHTRECPQRYVLLVSASCEMLASVLHQSMISRSSSTLSLSLRGSVALSTAQASSTSTGSAARRHISAGIRRTGAQPLPLVVCEGEMCMLTFVMQHNSVSPRCQPSRI